MTVMTTELSTHAPVADAGEMEQHRAALARHCRRMLGSSAEADDAVQETMIRTWRALDRFEARGSLRTWLYHIATNVCFDALRRRRRHAVAVDLGPGSTHAAAHVTRRRGTAPPRARRTERRRPPRLRHRSPAPPPTPARDRDPARRLPLEGR